MLPAAKDSTGAQQIVSRYPFDAQFFQTILPDRVQAACPGQGDRVPVVLLDLADGRQLDLCHVDLLTTAWMAVSAFSEKKSCDEMDVVFVPYEMIALVTVSKRKASQRGVGFKIEEAAGGGGEMTAGSSKQGHVCAPANRAKKD